MIRILQGTELTLEEDLLALFQCVPQKSGSVAYEGCYHIAVGVKLFQDILNLQSRFVIQMLKNDILLLQNPGNLVFQELLIEELADLEADLCIFIRIEGSDSGLCRTEGFLTKTLLLALVKQNVVGHHDLSTVRNQDLRSRNPFVHDALYFFEQKRDVQCHTVSDDACSMVIKNA